MLSVLRILFILNVAVYITHIYMYCSSIFYFFQLTIIGQTLVVVNFLISILLHHDKESLHTKLLLSRLHLITLSLQSIVVIGYWGLRVFFTQGIIKQGQERDLVMEILGGWVHGGSLLTMLYFVKLDQIVSETSKKKKFLLHLGWGFPFIVLQFLHWKLSGQHVYGFLKHFDWIQLIVFEATLYLLAVWIDYFLTLRHGYKLSLKHLQYHHEHSD